MNFSPRLATRFSYGRVNTTAGSSRALCGQFDTALSEDALRAHVPSIFADGAHTSRSARYGYIPTIEMVRGLGGEDFTPVFACEAKARDEGKVGYTKHMVRFRRPDIAGHGNLGATPELILINSHDGSTSYQLLAGLFRFVCANGVICGDGFDEIRIRHKAHGNLVHDVIEGAYRVVDTFTRALTAGERMKALPLSAHQALAFGEAALDIKYYNPETERREAPITAGQVICPRRNEDQRLDLWTTFNVVQENLVRGGLQGRAIDATGRLRRATTRAVNGIDGNVRLNRALWTLADRMAEMVTPAAA
jgi:hypothetical protein